MYQFPEPIKELHKIYSPDFPDFLRPFMEAPEMQRLGGVSQTCGIAFTKFHNYKFLLTRLDHSVGVALIIWYFTQDKKQTLAGLFHDISHTAFSHVGDFLRGDYENQESSEIFHDKIISNSPSIMNELKKLWINFEEVNDYTKYPIADNNWPQLASDRLEYNFCELICYSGDLEKVKRLYSDIVVLKNEYEEDELGFQSLDKALEFGNIAIDNDAQVFSSYESKLGMSFLSELLKDAFESWLFTLNDLYQLTDMEVFWKIEQGGNDLLIKKLKYFQNMRYYKVRVNKPKIGEFVVDTKNKRRYIDPLVKTRNGNIRLSKLDQWFKERADLHKNKTVEWVSCDWVEERSKK